MSGQGGDPGSALRAELRAILVLYVAIAVLPLLIGLVFGR